MRASFFCLQKFKVCDSNLARSNGFKYVLGAVQRVDEKEWDARVKIMNGSICMSNTG